MFRTIDIVNKYKVVCIVKIACVFVKRMFLNRKMYTHGLPSKVIKLHILVIYIVFIFQTSLISGVHLAETSNSTNGTNQAEGFNRTITSLKNENNNSATLITFDHAEALPTFAYNDDTAMTRQRRNRMQTRLNRLAKLAENRSAYGNISGLENYGRTIAKLKQLAESVVAEDDDDDGADDDDPEDDDRLLELLNKDPDAATAELTKFLKSYVSPQILAAMSIPLDSSPSDALTYSKMESPTSQESDHDRGSEFVKNIPGYFIDEMPVVRKHDREEDATTEDDDEESESHYSMQHSNKHQVGTFVLEAETNEDVSCWGKRGGLKEIMEKSKYFGDSRNRYSYNKAKTLCENYNLVMAELEGLADHRSIQIFVSQFKSSTLFSKDDKFFIGPNDLRHEGMYMRADGKKLAFQNYHLSQPDDEDMKEDCTALGKENPNGPVGSSDDDCSKLFYPLCMFRVNSQCYNESKETIENRKIIKEVKLLVNASERTYFISNYQATWFDALNYCSSNNMHLFYFDKIITMGFLKQIVKRESTFFDTIMPTVQYWTAGKFKQTHMNAQFYWYSRPNMTNSEERTELKHFAFSGIFKWSTKKKVDPGGPYVNRRDLCLSFGFETKPDATPYVRNTNCDIPCYFICYKEKELHDTPPEDRKKRSSQ